MDYRARFEALIAAAADGIIVIDPGGIVQVYNPACERLFGYPAEEVVGRNIRMLMPLPYHEQHDEYLENYRTTGERRIIGIGRNVVGQRKDGTTFPMYLSVGEGRDQGASIFVGIIRDLTERESVERRMQELQGELLHVSRLSAMGEMSSALAHEINQPLAAITNYLKAAHRTMGDLTDPAAVKARELVEKASAQTVRAGQVIRRLRDFIEKGETNRVPENLNQIIEEAMALALVGAGNTGVRTRTEFKTEMPPVLTDKIQIQQVLLNLIRNAFEAMQEVTNRQLTIQTVSEGDFAVVTVTDTGPGLHPDVTAKLFQPFTTTKGSGMGIGLSISKSIIDAHGGRLWATPNRDVGVSFHFTLPLAG